MLTREGYNAEYLDQPVRDAESLLKESIAGRDSVLFLAPMGVYDNIAVEVWQAVAQWDLQDDAGVLQAVRHGVDECHPEFSQTLANLTSRITTAAGSDAFADQRVANVSGLTQLYQDIGAYRDITPDDGSSNVFTPAAPLPVQVSTSVGTTANFPLTRDCSILLDLKDTLAGTASLNWSKDTAINSWTGVTLSGTPQRVTGLALASGNLNGTLPAGLGRLHGLTSLDLSGNALTGSIPAVLGDLPGLGDPEDVGQLPERLHPGSPEGPGDKRPGDPRHLFLRYADAADPVGVNVAAADGVFTPTWDAVEGASKYEAQHSNQTPVANLFPLGRRWTLRRGDRRLSPIRRGP